MAGFQSAQRWLDDDADIDDWMARRNADAQQLGPDAAAAGREAWAQSTRTGENLSAGQPADVISIGVQAFGQDAPSAQGDAESASLEDETPLPLATVGQAVTPVALPSADNLTSLPEAFGSASRFATARLGDSISRLLGTSDPTAIGKFLTLNGLDGQASALFAGHSYAIPSSSDDASPDEVAAGERLLKMDNAKLADARDQRASMQTSTSQAPAAPVRSIGAASPEDGRTIQYGALSAALPSDRELSELRRQQAAFSNTTQQIDIQNSWFAIPALAAPLIALGLGGAGALGPEVAGMPLDFLESDPYLRVGDNWATRAGRLAHKWLENRLDAKEGWESEPRLPRPGQRPLRPDVGTPRDDPTDSEPKYYLELKPNTVSGRAAAARSVKRYQGVTKRKIRPIYYNPGDFM